MCRGLPNTSDNPNPFVCTARAAWSSAGAPIGVYAHIVKSPNEGIIAPLHARSGEAERIAVAGCCGLRPRHADAWAGSVASGLVDSRPDAGDGQNAIDVELLAAHGYCLITPL